jgi:hypothetical protein
MTAMAVDKSNGRFYVVGRTFSTNFAGANSSTFGGGQDAVISAFSKDFGESWQSWHNTKQFLIYSLNSLEVNKMILLFQWIFIIRYFFFIFSDVLWCKKKAIGGPATDIYAIGSTNSVTGLNLRNSFNSNLGGASDVLLYGMTATGVATMISYYGGTAIDNGNGIAIDSVA